MKIVLDTNVLVSALANPAGRPAQVVEGVLGGLVELGADERILAEYQEVLCRPQLAFPEARTTWLLERIVMVLGGRLAEARRLDVSLPDPDDAMFLEVALAGQADAIVTGNKRHFPLEACGNVRILSPAELLEELGEEE